MTRTRRSKRPLRCKFDASMRQRFVRYASVTSVVGIALSFLTFSTPPSLLPIYFIFLCLALIALTLGTGPYRVLGGVATIATLALMVAEYRAGVRREHYRELLQQPVRHQRVKTNPASTVGEKPSNTSKP